MNNNTLPAFQLVLTAFNIGMVCIKSNTRAQVEIEFGSGQFCILAHQSHIFPDLSHSCIAVIMQKIPIQINGITLYNVNMAESIQ